MAIYTAILPKAEDINVNHMAHSLKITPVMPNNTDAFMHSFNVSLFKIFVFLFDEQGGLVSVIYAANISPISFIFTTHTLCCKKSSLPIDDLFWICYNA